MIDLLKRRLAVRRRLRRALEQEDEAAVARGQRQLEELTLALQGFARGYGFKVCGLG